MQRLLSKLAGMRKYIKDTLVEPDLRRNAEIKTERNHPSAIVVQPDAKTCQQQRLDRLEKGREEGSELFSREMKKKKDSRNHNKMLDLRPRRRLESLEPRETQRRKLNE